MSPHEFFQIILKNLSALPLFQNAFVGTCLPPHTRAPALTVGLMSPYEEEVIPPRCYELTLTFWAKDYRIAEINQQKEATFNLLKEWGAIKIIEQQPPSLNPLGGLHQTLHIIIFRGDTHG